MLKINESLPRPRASVCEALTGEEFKPVVEKMGYKRAEAATYLGVKPVTIDRLTKRGLLHPSRALRHPIYSRDDLDQFLRDTR
jgi:hypothetical protein